MESQIRCHMILHCLPTQIFIQNEIEMKDRNEKNIPGTPKIGNELFQLIKDKFSSVYMG